MIVSDSSPCSFARLSSLTFSLAGTCSVWTIFYPSWNALFCSLVIRVSPLVLPIFASSLRSEGFPCLSVSVPSFQALVVFTALLSIPPKDLVSILLVSQCTLFNKRLADHDHLIGEHSTFSEGWSGLITYEFSQLFHETVNLLQAFLVFFLIITL